MTGVMTVKRRQLKYVPGKTKPSDMTDGEIKHEIDDAATTDERRAQLEDHKAWLREFRAQPVEEQTDIGRDEPGPRLGSHTPGEAVRTISELTPEQLSEVKKAADLMLSDQYREYLPGRVLAAVLSRYRDDVAAMRGDQQLPPPPLPNRHEGLPRQPGLNEMTNQELAQATNAVLVLVNYADTMDDPALPAIMREFRKSLASEASMRQTSRAAS